MSGQDRPGPWSAVIAGLIGVLVGCSGEPSGPDGAATAVARRAPRPPLTVESSSATGFVVRFRPEVIEGEITFGGRVYDSLRVAGSAMRAQPGAPAVPVIARPFALPEGATATARVVSVRTRTRRNRWLRPTHPRWEDNVDAPNPPVTERAEDYGSDRVFPDRLAVVEAAGDRLAGVNTGVLQLSVARFSPSTRELDIVEDMRVEVTFDRAFDRRPAPRRPAEQVFGRELINDNVIAWAGPLAALGGPEYLIVTDDTILAEAQRLAVWKRQKGISTLVVSTSVIGTTPAAIKAYIQSVYDAPASRLGYLLLFGDVETIPTHYVDDSNDTVDIASDLPYAKLDGLDAHADVAYGRISVDGPVAAGHVVDKILDYEQTPSRDAAVYDAMTFTGYFQEDKHKATLSLPGMQLKALDFGPDGNLISFEILDISLPNVPLTVSVSGTAITMVLGTDAGSDVDSSWRDVLDALVADPDVAALVTTTAKLDTDSDGIDDFPLDDTAHALTSAYLEDGQLHDGVADKPYVDILEDIRTVMLGHGKVVDRLYSSNTTYGPGPLFFSDGSFLPYDLTTPSGFTWDADEVDIDGAFDAGRALIWHRDHGTSAGWYEPRYENPGGVQNGDIDPADAYEDRYPVVFSINCSTGRFDQETDPTFPDDESFAEQVLRDTDGGGVAVIAATRTTDTDLNQFIAEGLFDFYWHDVTVAFSRNVAGAPITLRLGDALVYAKDWLLTQPTTEVALTVDQVEEYHLHGDPTLEMWIEAPLPFGGLRAGWVIVAGVPVLHVEFTSAAGAPQLALWQADAEVSRARLVRSTVKHGGVDWIYELDRPATAGATALYLTQPGYRPSITTIAPP